MGTVLVGPIPTGTRSISQSNFYFLNRYPNTLNGKYIPTRPWFQIPHGLRTVTSEDPHKTVWAAPTVIERVRIPEDQMVGGNIYQWGLGEDGWLSYISPGSTATIQLYDYGQPDQRILSVITLANTLTYTGIKRTFSDLEVGKTYYLSAQIQNYSTPKPIMIGVQGGTSGTPVTSNGSWQQITHQFVATSTSHTVIIYATSYTMFYAKDMSVDLIQKKTRPRPDAWVVPTSNISVGARGLQQNYPNYNDSIVMAPSIADTGLLYGAWQMYPALQDPTRITRTISYNNLDSYQSSRRLVSQTFYADLLMVSATQIDVNTRIVTPDKQNAPARVISSNGLRGVTTFDPASEAYTLAVSMQTSFSVYMSSVFIGKPSFTLPAAPEIPDPEDENPPAWGGITIRAMHGIVVDMDTPTITDGKPHS